MKVATLQQFLHSLVSPLQSISDPSRTGETLETVVRALDLFRELDVLQFFTFLTRCEEYQRNGIVPVPKAQRFDLEPLETSIRNLASRLAFMEEDSQIPPLKSDLDNAQKEVIHATTPLLKSLGISGTLKGDSKWIDEKIIRIKSRKRLQEFKELASRITCPESYTDTEIKSSLDHFRSESNLEELKIFGEELQVRVSGRNMAKILDDLLASITGCRAQKISTRKASKSSPLDETKIKQKAIQLTELLEKSNNPDLISEPEIERQIQILDEMTLPEIKAILKESSLDLVGRSKTDLLKKVKHRLLAARIAVDRVNI